MAVGLPEAMLWKHTGLHAGSAQGRVRTWGRHAPRLRSGRLPRLWRGRPVCRWPRQRPGRARRGGQGEHSGPPAWACRGHRRRPVLVDAAGVGCAVCWSWSHWCQLLRWPKFSVTATGVRLPCRGWPARLWQAIARGW